MNDSKQDLQRQKNAKTFDEILEVLTDLDNPNNRIYKDALTLMVLRPYVNMVFGKNPDGTSAFKLELSQAGKRIVDTAESTRERFINGDLD